MTHWKLILPQVAILSWCQVSAAQFVPPAGPVILPDESCGESTPVMIVPGQPLPGQPMFGQPMMVAPGVPMSPVYGQPAVITPLPTGAPPGTAIAPPVVGPPIAGPPIAGSPSDLPIAPNPQGMNLGPNPISLPPIDEMVAWDQIVDVISDYFTVAREQQVRRSGEVWTEGLIETAPQDGASWLEPFRKDSVGAFNRWESTFQTIRRRAHVRVMPDASGYLVEVIVEKELEDLPNPEKATAGGAVFRDNNGPTSRRLEQVSRTRLSPLWIQLGRDPLLEQRILGDIQARLGGLAAGPAVVR